MSLSIVPLVLGYYTGEKGVMTYLKDHGQPIVRPFVMWFIQGASRNILVDTAIEKQDYLDYLPQFAGLELTELQTFDQALASVGITPEEVEVVVQTHLHFDHCANLKRCPNAEVLVQRAEYELAMDPAPFAAIYRPEYWEGVNLKLIEGELELEPGVNLLPTPGHTAGGQAVLVDTNQGVVAIPGMCTCQENFAPQGGHSLVGDEELVLPGILWQARAAYESMKLLQSRADRILALHDPGILQVKRIG